MICPLLQCILLRRIGWRWIQRWREAVPSRPGRLGTNIRTIAGEFSSNEITSSYSYSSFLYYICYTPRAFYLETMWGILVLFSSQISNNCRADSRILLLCFRPENALERSVSFLYLWSNIFTQQHMSWVNHSYRSWPFVTRYTNPNRFGIDGSLVENVCIKCPQILWGFWDRYARGILGELSQNHLSILGQIVSACSNDLNLSEII